MVQGDSVQGLVGRQLCNVVAGERGFINPASLQARGINIQDYTLGTKLFSKEPIALVTRQGDPKWSDFVEWTMQALIFAEEKDQLSANSGLGTTDVFAPTLPTTDLNNNTMEESTTASSTSTTSPFSTKTLERMFQNCCGRSWQLWRNLQFQFASLYCHAMA